MAEKKKVINMRERFGKLPAEQQKAIGKALCNGMGSTKPDGAKGSKKKK